MHESGGDIFASAVSSNIKLLCCLFFPISQKNKIA